MPEEKSLKRSLLFLDDHIRLLETWCRRRDTHPGLASQLQLVCQQFQTVMDQFKNENIAILNGPNGLVKVFRTETEAKLWLEAQGWKNKKEINPNTWSLDLPSGEYLAELKIHPFVK